MDFKLRSYVAGLQNQPLISFLSREVLTDCLLKVGFRYTSDLAEYQKALKNYLDHTIDHATKFNISGKTLVIAET